MSLQISRSWTGDKGSVEEKQGRGIKKEYREKKGGKEEWVMIFFNKIH